MRLHVYRKKQIRKRGRIIIHDSYDATGNRIRKSAGGTTTYYVRDATGNVMSVYEKTDTLKQKEVHLYGSSKLGILQTDTDVQTCGTVSTEVATFLRGLKLFELSNHLGNVLATISDKKFGLDTNGDGMIDYYTADVVSANDYYPFGMMMPGRKFSTARLGGLRDYRYGYQGSEKTNEIDGSGNHYTTHFRELNVRISRWWSIDPKISASPWLGSYVSMSNNPVMLVDPLGDKEYKSEKQFARQNKGKIWDKDKGEGDWLRSHRIYRTETWKTANEYNLQQQNGYNEYTSISQRAAFYQWFQTITEQQGSETKWAGAAAIVAGQMAQVEDPFNAWIVGKDVVNFANAGNKAIFNDVFGDLRALYNKGASGTQ